MTQQPQHDTPQPEASGYVINPENAAEMARLTRLAEILSEEIGLLPQAIDLTSRAEILDVGCGPGGWVMEVARRFPTSRVRGIDISNLMIAYAQFCAQAEKRSNVQFSQADARHAVPFPDAVFDVVHARLAGAWLSNPTWPVIIQNYYRVLKPGGVACCIECESLGVTNSAALTRYGALGVQGTRRANQCFSPSDENMGVPMMLPKFFRDAGFRDIQREAHAVLYSYGAASHQAMFDTLASGLKLLQPFLLSQQVATQAELDVLYDQAIKDMLSEDFHAIMYYFSVWGTK